MIQRRLLRPIVFVLGLVCALCAVMELRCVLEARAALAEAERSLARGDVAAAVPALRAAARWDAPFNAYADRAYVALERVAQQAERDAQHELALTAYRSIHAALHATRGLEVSDPALLGRADDRIAALMARERPPEIDAALSLEERTVRYRELLRTVKQPSTFGVLLSCAGFVTWVTAFAVLVLRGIDREGRVLRHIARPSFLCLVFGWVAFAVGLRIA